MTAMPVRTLRVSPEGLVNLLQAITAGDVRPAEHGIPPNVAVSTIVGWNAHDRVLEIELIGQGWEDPEPTAPYVGFTYARRYSHTGQATDWGPPQQIGPPAHA